MIAATPSPGPFDLILCRNVLIYFDAETRASVLDVTAAVYQRSGS